MTNLSGSPEDHGPAPSQNGGQTHDSEAIDLDNKMVSDIVNGGSSVANGWHHFDEDSNLSFDSGSASQRNKRKLSVDSADSAEYKKKSKLARTLLEDGKHGVIDGRWVCGQCGKSLSSPSGLDQHIQTVHGAYILPCDHCDLKFKRKDHVRNHMRRVHECVKTCSKCPGKQKFKGREAYAEHMKTVHKIKLTFRTMQNEDRKGYIDSSSASFDSTPIPKIPEFKKKTLAQLKAEKPPRFTKKDDPDDPYAGKRFKGKSDPNEKKPCGICGKPVSKSNFNRHLRTHPEYEEDKDYGQSEWKRIGRPPRAAKEEILYTEMDDEDKTDDESMMMPPPGKSPYKRRPFHKENSHGNENVMQLCTLCRRYFPGSTCLHMHQKTHHKTRLNDDIILKCSYCSGVFREQSSLEEHVRFFSFGRRVPNLRTR